VRLDIRYRCSFEYDELVRESQNELRVCPLSDERQTLLSYRVHTSPAARVYSFEDYWGTRVDAFGVREPHIFLEVTAEATVETKGQQLITSSPPMSAVLDPWFTDLNIEYLERTRHVDWDDALRDDARRQVELAGNDLVSAVLAIHRRVGGVLTYEPGTTYVGVSIDELLARGAGVCQDYAHLAIAMCRSVGIPARYVSGYLFTADDASGRDVEGDVVSVQTHAWFEAAIPGFGWFALDPTNRQEVSLRHVTIGRGRDYDDVPPLRGVYTGPPDAELDVSVEMRRLGEVAAQVAAQQQQQ
jgi:transglutaminase-like putative cysteine protease